MKTADILRSWLVKVKQAMPNSKKKGVIYKIPCKDCPCVYIGETGSTLEKRLSEHKAAVKKNDPKNGIAVHSWEDQHQVNWGASVKQEERSYWRRRILHNHQQHRTSNLDCGLNINDTWLPLLDKPPSPKWPPAPNQNTPLLCTPLRLYFLQLFNLLYIHSPNYNLITQLHHPHHIISRQCYDTRWHTHPYLMTRTLPVLYYSWRRFTDGNAL